METGTTDYTNDRHWEVNGPRYKKRKDQQTTEADFQDMNRFLAGRKNNLEKQSFSIVRESMEKISGYYRKKNRGGL